MSVISLQMHLDGKLSQCGYKFIVQKEHGAWKAFRTEQGFRYFLENYGLKIDRRFTQLYDLREQGLGRTIVSQFYPKNISELYFWDMREIPEKARPVVQLVNGSYVHCYILDDGDNLIVYKPNPNAKDVYVPFDYWAVNKKIG